MSDQSSSFWRKTLQTFIAWLKPTPIALPEAEHPEGVSDLPMDTKAPARLGFWVLGVGFGGFLLWAAFAPLNEGVPTAGMVTIETKRKSVQHLTGGIIKAVHVKEGQFVQRNDPLLVIDDAATLANFESTRLRYYTLRATEARLVAEQKNLPALSFHPDLLKVQEDPLVSSMLQNQATLFTARRSALETEIQAMEESVRGHAASIQGYKGLLSARKEQLKLLKEESQGLRELVVEGYAPRNNLLALERTTAETLGSMADLQGNLERAMRAMTETKLRILQREQEYRKEVETQLSEVCGQVDAEGERFRALEDELKRTIIRSPADGQVVGLTAQTIGGIVSPGQKIMDIVPQDERLLLETQVPPHLIDRVHLELPVDVRFSSFAHSPQLVVPGKVESIAGDLLTDEHTGASYYLARVSVTEEGMKILGGRQMQAGMPAEVIIITGERSMLVYLLRPLLKRMAVAMKEE